MPHIQKFFYIACILVSPRHISNTNKEPKFVVWNTGQGQWVTAMTPTHCFHFDAGGDRPIYGPLKRFCRHKVNELFISHPDTDHINQIWRLKKNLPNVCLANKITGALSIVKKKLIRKLKKCPGKKRVQIIYSPKKDNSKLKANALSQVFMFKNLLISGDGEKKQESKWSNYKAVKKSHYFVIGHHGSNTSNAESLIKKLAHLKLAIASSRKRRYGHPHRLVLKRFQKYKIPVITTNNWGNIYIY